VNQNPEYDDVRPLVPAGKPKTTTPIVPPSSGGCVYLFRHGKTNDYKIGATKDLNRRTGEVDSPLPQGLTVIHSIPSVDPFVAEKFWHQVFADRRGKKEWFALTAADVSRFKACKSM